jgi:GATA-binding protein
LLMATSSSPPNALLQHLHQTDDPLDTLAFTPPDPAVRQGMLADSFFPALKNDADEAAMGSPEELQKNDPLGTQIWKLYSKARTQLPNAERMENLTWRMMALNMRRAAERERERERNKGYGRRHVQLVDCVRRVHC